ncbi:MAG: energy transducer TonB [Longimicrobiales bacterium]|nr:energy transducer TonB [Longimicrobiales bacterium]
MTTDAAPSHLAAVAETANDRLKRSWDTWFWGSMIAAILVHFGTFQFWPDMTAADVSFSNSELEAIELPPEIEIPPPPEAIARPATPVIAEAEVSEDITIAPTTFEDNPVENLPPPPESTGEGDISAAPTFTPYTVAPGMTNGPEVIRALEREYPPLLRDAGIGGTANIWFFIDEDGRVQDTRIQQSSGHAQLDEAALKVAGIMRFSPALNRDKKVPVWVTFPITFQVR